MGVVNFTPEVRKKISDAVKKKHAEGRYAHVKHNHFTGKHHSQETKDVISKRGRESNHRRLKKYRILYKDIWLDSTWELALAQRLDELGIAWIRPEPLRWVDSDGNNHNYFPDFYLPQFDLYLDPKNPMAIETQKEKLTILMKQYPNIMILYSLEECQQYQHPGNSEVRVRHS